MHQFDGRTGVRIGGGHFAGLVKYDVADDSESEQHRRLVRVDTAYREWARNRSDADRLRRLQVAIDEPLEAVQA